MNRPVLVTGASGFIGRHLVAALLTQRKHVRVLVRRQQAARELAALGAESVVGDLVGSVDLARATSGIGIVYHLAGQLFRPGTPPDTYGRIHIDATTALLDACRRHAVLEQFVLCTTTGVLGPTGPQPAHEEDPCRPQNAYEETKARSEQLARDVASRNKLPLVIARPGLVYGPGDLHLLGLFRAIRGGYYGVIGSGTNRVHPIFVRDVVQGLLLTAERGRRDGRAYHLVGPRPVTMRDLSNAIGEAVGRRVPRYHLPVPIALAAGIVFETLPIPRARLPLSRTRVRFMTEERVYDGARAAVELGFVPRVELETGLAETVQWYRERGLLR